MEENKPHVRRKRYSGTHPKRFEEKYKELNPEKYAETIGVKSYDLSRIEESVDFLKSGTVDYEFRTTIVNEFHTVEDIRNVAEWIKGAKRYFLQNFVDSGNLIDGSVTGVSKQTMLEMQKAAADFVPQTEIRGI